MQTAAIEVDSFLDSLRSPHTKKLYAMHRKRFLDFIAQRSITLDNPEKATQEIIQYLKKLQSEGLSYSHRNNSLMAIKHDYLMSDALNLNWKKIAKFLGVNSLKQILHKVSPLTRMSFF
jgi:site-specific recombinase XerD